MGLLGEAIDALLKIEEKDDPVPFIAVIEQLIHLDMIDEAVEVGAQFPDFVEQLATRLAAKDPKRAFAEVMRIANQETRFHCCVHLQKWVEAEAALDAIPIKRAEWTQSVIEGYLGVIDLTAALRCAKKYHRGDLQRVVVEQFGQKVLNPKVFS